MTDISCATWDTEEDKRMADEWAEKEAGNPCQMSPELRAEFEKAMPEVEKVVQEKNKELDKLERPREERVREIIGRVLAEEREPSPRAEEGDVKEFKAFGVCPVEVRNFSNPSAGVKSSLGNNEEVIKVLNELPQVGLLAFEGVKYTGEDKIIKDTDGQLKTFLGRVATEESGRATVEINAHLPRLLLKELELDRSTPQEIDQKVQEIETGTIIHEYAHGVWRELTTLDEQWEWLNLHDRTTKFVSNRASESVKEDFCESSIVFFTDQKGLEDIDEGKYNFLKEFYDSLKEESQWLAKEFAELENE